MQQMEHLACKFAAVGTPTVAMHGTSTPADYLDHEKRRRRSRSYSESAAHDGTVGFGFSKGDGKLEQARGNLGHAHVSSIWAYQGSKPFVAGGKLYSGLGDTVHCAEPETGEVRWKTKLRDTTPGEEMLDSLLTPPATVNGKLFMGTTDARVLCLAAATGETLWSVNVGEPVQFQPVVAAGRVYAVTHNGSLFCLETGDPGDDGWLMWGANPAHNGLPD